MWAAGARRQQWPRYNDVVGCLPDLDFGDRYTKRICREFLSHKSENNPSVIVWHLKRRAEFYSNYMQKVVSHLIYAAICNSSGLRRRSRRVCRRSDFCGTVTLLRSFMSTVNGVTDATGFLKAKSSSKFTFPNKCVESQTILAVHELISCLFEELISYWICKRLV